MEMNIQNDMYSYDYNRYSYNASVSATLGMAIPEVPSSIFTAGHILQVGISLMVVKIPSSFNLELHIDWLYARIPSFVRISIK